MEQIDQSVSLSLDNIEALSTQIKLLALQSQHDPLELLRILRILEQLHLEICNDIFQPALPTSRHALFDFLRDLESNGGWPHIYRRNLAQVFDRLEFLLSDQVIHNADNDLSR
ncbi:hypothetical protein Syn7502_00405 [Synechococcus sp. PCC 7502]|uniref:hypothetical protein n=1 Tax=Synechococcus sp. PCC 7502 TaxID=1173263 RepID=UPI00029FAA39|nr:hypothetical protein [Synechococcus sp. PCC 7502]AFY72569.1 hypothetical protein Syn7502_00405 [Synechococcus sp. PCC 7502]